MGFEWVAVALVAGSLVYCVLVLVAQNSWLASQRTQATGLRHTEAISVLKPLSGIDEDLEQNLRTFFEQDYPEFEVLFTVRHADDPALALVERLQREYPNLPSRLIVTGEPPYPYPNHKVYCLNLMMAAAKHSLLVMSDSDIRVKPDFLPRIAGEFQDPNLSVTTCPYRAVAGRHFWSKLEAIGMNTEFLAGVLVARLVEGMRFALGPTIVARREAILAIGGWDRVKDYLAEDFVLGNVAAEKGLGVGLSSTIVEHRIGSQPLAANFRHRLRWYRSTRRSRPAGYVGQLFTYTLPLALILWLAAPHWWPLCVAALACRAAAAWTTAARVLGGRVNWLLLPLQDSLSFAFWIAGFFGNTITWRGHHYYLHRDGRFERIS